jgi:Mrr N-terminal domain
MRRGTNRWQSPIFNPLCSPWSRSSVTAVTDLLAESFHLTDQEREREELLPSGQQSLFSNRVAWAKSHLKAAGLLENPLRGRVRISDLGRQVLAEKPAAINIKFLKRFPAYCDFIGKSALTHDEGVSGETAPVEERRTPLELIDAAYKSLRQATAEALLSKLKAYLDGCDLIGWVRSCRPEARHPTTSQGPWNGGRQRAIRLTRETASHEGRLNDRRA